MVRRNGYSVIRVGILATVAIALLAFGIMVIGRGTRYLTGSLVVEAHFQRINNLQPGAPVTLGGMNIGAVQSIYFPPNPRAPYIVVKMWIERRASQRIRSDSVASIRTMGLLGDKYIEIAEGNPNARAIQSGEVLNSENPVGYESVLGGFRGSEDLMANLLAISVSLRNISEAVEKSSGLAHQILYGEATPGEQPSLTLAAIRQAVDHAGGAAAELQEVLQKASHGKGVAAALLSDKTNGNAMLANVSRSVKSLRHTSETLDQMVTRYDAASGTIPQLMMDQGYARNVMGNVDQTSRELAQIVHKINTGEGTLGLLINDPSLYKQAQQLLSGNATSISILKTLYEFFHERSDRSRDSEEMSRPVSENDLDPEGGIALLAQTPSTPDDTASGEAFGAP